VKGSIFLERGDKLVEMNEQPWEAEARLQELLAKYPNLLAGDQMNELAPRRWLLISREFGIPGEVDAAGRWSLDHLFLDQDAIPTLVEVKRSTDTRTRREVVGQMLDYASHLVSNVSAERIRQKYEDSAPGEPVPGALLAPLLGDEVDDESYWQRLKDNIAAGKLRLVFVADEFPPELRRIVEFMNRQMQQTDVFAVEVRQFVSPDGAQRTLVPRLIGKVESKTPTESPRPTVWDWERFESTLAQTHPELVGIASQLLRLGADLTGRSVEWGRGRTRGSFTARLVVDGLRLSLFSVYTIAEVSINIGWHSRTLANLDPELSEEVRRRTNGIFGTEFNASSWERGWPMIPLSSVQRNLAAFTSLVSEMIKRLRQALDQR
jgi:hypothetical protein